MLPAARQQHQEASTGVVVLFVRSAVLGEMRDALRHEADLYRERPGVVLKRLHLLHDGSLVQRKRFARVLVRLHPLTGGVFSQN